MTMASFVVKKKPKKPNHEFGRRNKKWQNKLEKVNKWYQCLVNNTKHSKHRFGTSTMKLRGGCALSAEQGRSSSPSSVGHSTWRSISKRLVEMAVVLLAVSITQLRGRDKKRVGESYISRHNTR